MILSDKQYNVSKAELAKLKAALVTTENREIEQEWLRKAGLDALASQIEEIESELAEYDQLKSGQITFSKTYALEDLPRVLVQARIAAGMSQTDLAVRLGMKPQQVQRYEATNYMGASLARLIEVSRVLGVKASGTFEGTKQACGSMFVWSDANDIVWSQLPYKEMIKRKWFKVPRNVNPLEAVKEYFLNAAGPQFATAYHRKKMHSGNTPNEYALLAWQARILEHARRVFADGDLAEFKLDYTWLPDLISLTRYSDGPKRAGRLLAEKGIALIAERHLPGSYLDGAAMLGDAERPVIGLTLRHDRLDNFWFVLLHELGHVFLHLFDGQRYDFFDEESASDNDFIEAAADKFALDSLIPEELWGKCLSRFALSEEAVRLDAESLGIDPSIIAGRIRKERDNYTILKNLVGYGQVRSQFEESVDDLD
jgi:HTH-type transcriptional regulator / antitoxin HigA